ncbi:tRNA guanine10-N2-methyltransferase-like [Hondaea fermentalgiana]|uniref:tRNA (guanine(10)-N(2))-methyltransferase n=1 Tax=Hondaea fermentalgiana TaxID=2315210 RepID=A0A2R5G4Y4_9STRA|nr:tRNA guanine10-N2-methyltransferase-like [Hondaea fermentalgiana]|eukprot:GBG26092.1 tRNA guanine10-N2-methyltransferase-like [Hondaea fermentalgiana]
MAQTENASEVEDGAAGTQSAAATTTTTNTTTTATTGQVEATSPATMEEDPLMKPDFERGRHLVHFRDKHPDFWVQELDALLDLTAGVKDSASVYDKSSMQEGLPFVRANFPSEECVKAICARSMCIKAIYEVWGAGLSLDGAFAQMSHCPAERREPFAQEDKTWCVRVRAYGRKISNTEEQARRESLLAMKPGLRGKVSLTEPDCILWVIDCYNTEPLRKSNPVNQQTWTREDGEVELISKREKKRRQRLAWKEEMRAKGMTRRKITKEKIARRERDEKTGGPPSKPQPPTDADAQAALEQERLDKQEQYTKALHAARDQHRPTHVFIARAIATGSRSLAESYTLKKRAFLGPTSMESTMSFIMANQAKVDAGQLVIDPFVGTGSLLVPCTVFGAVCQGGDIDFMLLQGRRGVTDATVNDTFDQYKLPRPDLLRLDFSPRGRSLREPNGGIYDAIVCDPPYGIRAGAKKVGRDVSKRPLIEDVAAQGREDIAYIAPVQPYETMELMADLVDASARLLKVGGRLVYLLPIDRTCFVEEIIPTHPCLTLVARSVEPLRPPLGRMLITMEKTAPYDYDLADEYRAETRRALVISETAQADNGATVDEQAAATAAAVASIAKLREIGR